MFSSLGLSLSVTRIIKNEERRIKILRDVMSTLYDLDGAVSARQSGVVDWSLQNLVLHAVLYRLVSVGTELPSFRRIEQEWYLAIDTLERQNADIAVEARRLYLRAGEPTPADVRSVLEFVSNVVYDGAPASPEAARDIWTAQLNVFQTTLTKVSRRAATPKGQQQ